MPTLAIGNKPPPDAGFSLVEALTALMVIGLLVGAVVLAAPGADHKVRDEAQRLAARIVAAQDESILINRPVALVVTQNGYAFERLEHQGWVAAGHGAPLGFRAWPADLNVQIEQQEGAEGDARIARFDALGGATPAALVLSGWGASWRVSVNGRGQAHVARAD
ncbi:MAG TPA: GspH/FimT family pseudopilin [Terricaulis sp.]|nr:GspH/FimT family pseudopilin [Terricaulis sp.]HRP10015.1 GspH/FimT family pseudopilin [Terricaulis sp.]